MPEDYCTKYCGAQRKSPINVAWDIAGASKDQKGVKKGIKGRGGGGAGVAFLAEETDEQRYVKSRRGWKGF